MTGSGYVSASQDKMNSTFDSVQEQSGLYITVGRHTQLDGAVIASTVQADKNRLDTGTLGFSDIHNEADYKVSHSGVSMSGGGSFGKDTFTGNMPGGMVSAGGSSGHAEGTTQAAVANGTITVRDTANQQQDVADLSRDTAHANDSLSPIFDKEKEQKRLQAVSLISEIGSQAMDIARSSGVSRRPRPRCRGWQAGISPGRWRGHRHRSWLTSSAISLVLVRTMSRAKPLPMPFWAARWRPSRVTARRQVPQARPRASWR